MTGEPLGAGMNGYAVMDQTTSGLRLRQMARAFIFGDDNDNRVVHVTADMGLMFQSIRWKFCGVSELFSETSTMRATCLSAHLTRMLRREVRRAISWLT